MFDYVPPQPKPKPLLELFNALPATAQADNILAGLRYGVRPTGHPTDHQPTAEYVSQAFGLPLDRVQMLLDLLVRRGDANRSKDGRYVASK